jgi:hypothetical protein
VERKIVHEADLHATGQMTTILMSSLPRENIEAERQP